MKRPKREIVVPLKSRVEPEKPPEKQPKKQPRKQPQKSVEASEYTGKNNYINYKRTKPLKLKRQKKSIPFRFTRCSTKRI